MIHYSAKWIWRRTTWFVSTWDRDAWQLVVLAIPLDRAVQYAVGLAPPQLNDEVIQPPWQIVALVVLGTAALLGIIGIYRRSMLIERLGMHLLGPTALIYGVCSVASDPGRGSVTLVVYAMIAACCFRRARKITSLLNWINSVRTEAAANKAGVAG